jgi:hypothetical protein
MDTSEANNISALFKKPMSPSVGLKKPGPTPAAPSMQPSRVYSHVNNNAPAESKSQTSAPVKKDFSLVDFSKNKVIKDNSIYDKTFRYKTGQALKGTLKFAADRQDVANALWNKRGYGGITKGEARKAINDLAAKRSWSAGKTRAVKSKMKIY